MRTFMDWSLDVLFQNRFCLGEQKPPTRANKGWINIKTGEIIMWSDLQKWHAQKMLSNTSDFRGIDRDELMSILGEEEFEELMLGYTDRDEVPAYVAYTDSKNWFAFVAGGNLAGVYTENLKQAQECMRWFEKKGWTWKDFFPTTTTYPFEIAMHGGQAKKKRGRIQWNREYIKDAAAWRNFIRTGRIQDTSKRSEIGNTMAMFRGESFEISQLDESKYGHTLWVDPKGKVHDMGRSEGNTHYQWVFDNFTKYFGNKQPKQGSDDVYDVPMQKGWARVRNHGMDISVEVDLRKLNRFQKKALRNIVDAGPEYGKELNRPMYIDAWKKNKTSRAGDIYLDNYEDIVDFLSENVQLNESGLKLAKAWIKGNKMISWSPRGIGEPYHLQKVAKSPKRFGLDREGIEKVLKQQKWLEYPVYYDAIVDGEEDRHEGFYSLMFENDWVMVTVQDYGAATIGSLRGKNEAIVHAAAKKMMEDKSFQKMLLGAEALEMEIFADSSGGLYGSGRPKARLQGVNAWMSYVETGRFATRRRSGVAMFRDWVEFSQ